MVLLFRPFSCYVTIFLLSIFRLLTAFWSLVSLVSEPIDSTILRWCSISANMKQTLQKALIRSVMTYAFPIFVFTADTHLLKLQRLQNMKTWLYSPLLDFQDAHRTGVAHGFPGTVYLWLHSEIVQVTSRGHTKSIKCKCSQPRKRWSPTQKLEEA
jgi:hypothetical protein